VVGLIRTLAQGCGPGTTSRADSGQEPEKCIISRLCIATMQRLGRMQSLGQTEGRTQVCLGVLYGTSPCKWEQQVQVAVAALTSARILSVYDTQIRTRIEPLFSQLLFRCAWVALLLELCPFRAVLPAQLCPRRLDPAVPRIGNPQTTASCETREMQMQPIAGSPPITLPGWCTLSVRLHGDGRWPPFVRDIRAVFLFIHY